jgi:hypothetical protein
MVARDGSIGDDQTQAGKGVKGEVGQATGTDATATLSVAVLSCVRCLKNADCPRRTRIESPCSTTELLAQAIFRVYAKPLDLRPGDPLSSDRQRY